MNQYNSASNGVPVYFPHAGPIHSESPSNSDNSNATQHDLVFLA